MLRENVALIFNIYFLKIPNSLYSRKNAKRFNLNSLLTHYIHD